MKKERTFGDILLDLEPLFFELGDSGIQKGDLLALVSVWVDTHYPTMLEEYYDDTNPIFYYGHPEGLLKCIPKQKHSETT